MSAERARLPQWAVPLVVLVGFGGLLLLSNRETTMPNGQPVIATNDQFNQVVSATQDQLAPVLKRMDAGEEPTDADRQALTAGIAPFEAAAAYVPTDMTPPFVLAKLHLSLGSYEAAEAQARQAIYNGEREIAKAKNEKNLDQEGRFSALVAEAHHVRSNALFGLQRYEEALDEATVAARAVPDDPRNTPNYLVAAGRALIQLDRIGDARLALRDALKLDPANRRALALKRLLASTD